MTLNELCLFAAVVFLLLLLFTLRSPLVRQPLGNLLISLLVGFGVLVEVSWTRDNPAFQWVFVEATTLLGTLLISFGRERRMLDVAWKFLMMNSAGLGLAFLGLILVGYALPAGTPFTWTALSRLSSPPSSSIIVQAGIWLAVFGYSAKLGLFPNHFWVTDTYAETPTLITAFIASFIPLVAAIPIRNLLAIETQWVPSRFNAHDAVLAFGLITMVYSIFSLYQTTQLKRIFATTAMFHTGALAIILRINLPSLSFYFYLASVVVVKACLFASLSAFMRNLGERDLAVDTLAHGHRIKPMPLFCLLLSFCAAFTLPLSPIFVSDIVVFRQLFLEFPTLAFTIGGLAVIFFSVGLMKLLPLINLLIEEKWTESKLQPNMLAIHALFTCSLALAAYGFWVQLF